MLRQWISKDTLERINRRVGQQAEEYLDRLAAPAERDVVKFNPPRHLKGAQRKAYQLGAQIYQRESHCATCHLAHGRGNANVYPPLVGSPWVSGQTQAWTAPSSMEGMSRNSGKKR